MSRRETAGHSDRPGRSGRVRAYLHRFFTSWVATDPEPEYSELDRRDGLGQVPDPVTTPRRPLPESAEVTEQDLETRRRSRVAGRISG